MITIERTTDADYIKSMITNPAVYSGMIDDSCAHDPKRMVLPPIDKIPGFFLKVISDGLNAGLFWLSPYGEGYEVHTVLLPFCHGRKALQAAKAGIAWMWQNTKAKFLRSYAFSDAPNVFWFCRAAGMTPVSEAPWPKTKNGQSVFITYFQLNRGS